MFDKTTAASQAMTQEADALATAVSKFKLTKHTPSSQSADDPAETFAANTETATEIKIPKIEMQDSRPPAPYVARAKTANGSSGWEEF